MKLSNKSINYFVENTSEVIKLTGNVVIAENNLVTNFNGAFYDVEDNSFLGNFYYSELNSEKLTKTISDVTIAQMAKMEQLLEATIKELKEVK